MSLSDATIDAITFDFGNTLVDARQGLEPELVGLRRALFSMFGPCEMGALREIRKRQIAAPEKNDWRENDLRQVHSEVVQLLYGVVPSDEQIQTLCRTQHESLVSALAMAPDAKSVLENMCSRYRIGLISNYPDGNTIRECLKRIGILGLFEVVVVSGDVGFVKPHRRPFEAMLEQLGVLPTKCVHVGDSLRADVQGAIALDMWAVLTTQYTPLLEANSAAESTGAYVRIEHLQDLEILLPSE